MQWPRSPQKPFAGVRDERGVKGPLEMIVSQPNCLGVVDGPAAGTLVPADRVDADDLVRILQWVSLNGFDFAQVLTYRLRDGRLYHYPARSSMVYVGRTGEVIAEDNAHERRLSPSDRSRLTEATRRARQRMRIGGAA
jgi:hypothetical protein